MHKDERQKQNDCAKHTRNSQLGKRGVNKRHYKANKVLIVKPEDIRGKK